MINYRTVIKDSWVQTAPSTRDLATLLGMATPATLRDIVNRIHQIETVHVNKAIHTNDSTPINGHVALKLYSDGKYVFSGHMRATGSTSYHFGVQAWAVGAGSTVVAAQKTGNVYGTDTPGRRQRNWTQSGFNQGITQHWRDLRGGGGIGYHLEAEINGVLGTAVDVLNFAVKGLAANLALGHYGWTLLIGNELAGMDAQITSPDILAGIVAVGAVFLVVGPFGLVPATIAGVGTASLIDIKHRALHLWERDFADEVFGGKIDYDRIVVTNLDNSGQAFVFPSIGNTILLNMGKEGYDNPMYYEKLNYPIKGEVFIHELTHAWQICRKSIVDVICGLSENYTYYTGNNRLADRSWQDRAWNGFNNEQQASIVNEWYRNNSATGLNSFKAINDPAYRFIRDNIRAGVN